ncbi:hypothetical protein RND81_03G231400 [Saponaria officinalis]|uniref:Uncharacterized protein n=1 Tax=Saponaria officinalis TaxID=3572 RepID=A0AAW1M9T5_SAPOF
MSSINRILLFTVFCLVVSHELQVCIAIPAQFLGGQTDCKQKCSERCMLKIFFRRCFRQCSTCCQRCSCVPPGTSGNIQACPCWATSTTGGRNKCP